MNERIKELALLAGYQADMFGLGHWDQPECQKFAELIIKKCIELVSTPSGLTPEYKIKNHFGIEDENKNIRIGK